MSVEWVFRAVLVLTWMISKFLGCCLFPLKIAMHGLFQIYRPPAFRWPLWTWPPVFINTYRVSQPSSLKYDYITWDALGLLEDVVETAEATWVKDHSFNFPEHLGVLQSSSPQTWGQFGAGFWFICHRDTSDKLPGAVDDTCSETPLVSPPPSQESTNGMLLKPSDLAQ